MNSSNRYSKRTDLKIQKPAIVRKLEWKNIFEKKIKSNKTSEENQELKKVYVHAGRKRSDLLLTKGTNRCYRRAS